MQLAFTRLVTYSLTYLLTYELWLQVKKDYKEKYWDTIDRDLAVQLGCLDIR